MRAQPSARIGDPTKRRSVKEAIKGAKKGRVIAFVPFGNSSPTFPSQRPGRAGRALVPEFSNPFLLLGLSDEWTLRVEVFFSPGWKGKIGDFFLEECFGPRGRLLVSSPVLFVSLKGFLDDFGLALPTLPTEFRLPDAGPMRGERFPGDVDLSGVKNKRCAVLGAGVTGLTVARLLQQAGAEISVFERDPVVGGLCRSDVVDGFVYDIAGGHVMFSRDPEVMAFLAGLLGPENLVRSERNTRIFFRDRFVQYPFENGICDLRPEDNFRCLKGFAEAFYRRQYEKPEVPTNFWDWVDYRFGDGIAELFMYPYNEKIWKTDLKKLSSDWVAGRVPDAPLEDILKTAVGIRTSGYKHQAIFFYPKNGGFQAIPDRLADPIRDHIRLETPVTSIRRVDGGYEINGESFDEVVCTLPMDKVYGLIDGPGVDEDCKQAAESLDYLSLASFLIGLDGKDESNDLCWVYLPHPENGACNRITYLTNYSPENGPPGTTSVLAEATFREEPADMEAMANQVVADLDRNGLLDKSKLRTLAWRKIEHAYVVFDMDFSSKREKAIAGLRSLGIHPVGRFGRYEYLNSDMCVRAAFDTAKELIGFMPELEEIEKGAGFTRDVYQDQNLKIGTVKAD